MGKKIISPVKMSSWRFENWFIWADVCHWTKDLGMPHWHISWKKWSMGYIEIHITAQDSPFKSLRTTPVFLFPDTATTIFSTLPRTLGIICQVKKQPQGRFMRHKYKGHLTHSNLSKDVSLIKTFRPAFIVNWSYYPKSGSVRDSWIQGFPRGHPPTLSISHLPLCSFQVGLAHVLENHTDNFSQQVQGKHRAFLQSLYKHPRQAAFID